MIINSISNWSRNLCLRDPCGFIPENPNDDVYKESVDAIRQVASHCRSNGQMFLYHAGQETPGTLLRTIQDVGLDNQGVRSIWKG